MSSARLAVIFAVAALIVIVLSAPLRVVLGDLGGRWLAGPAPAGTIWRGRIEDPRIGRLAFERLNLGLHLPSLLIGSRRVWFDARGGGSAKGLVSAGRAGVEILDLDADLPLRSVVGAAPMDGRLKFDKVTVRFEGGSCIEASGDVAIERLGLGGAGLPPGLRLVGRPSCRGGQLVIPLEGQVGATNIEAVMTVDGLGRYQLDTRLRSTDPAVGALVSAAGFSRTLQGFRHVDRGHLGPSPPA